MSRNPSADPTLAAVDFDPFASPELTGVAPSTQPQREVWTACRLGEDASLAFNESNSLRLRGALDVEALRLALGDLVKRHESLRTTFSGDGTTLCVAADQTLDVPLVDLSDRPEVERDCALRVMTDAEVEEPFVLERGPLFRVRLVKMAEREHVLVMTAHHIVCDGWSTAILVRDLGALYGARHKGVRAALPPAEPFSAYAREQIAYATSPEHAADEAFWLAQMSGALPVLELPFDRARRPMRSYASAREDITIPAPLIDAVKKTGAKHGSSLFVTLLAAFEALLHRLSGQDDFVVGIPAAGQSSGEHGELVGHAVNTVPIRARVDSAATFSDLLKSQRKLVLDAFDHQALTLGSLLQKLPIARDPSRPPLVSVLFNVDQPLHASALAWDGLEIEFTVNPRHYETFDLFVSATESPEGLVLLCQLNTDLLDAETLRRWMRSYESILKAIVARPETPIGALPILDDTDRAALARVNETAHEYARDACAHTLIERQIDRTPNAVAVRCGDDAITYAELDRRANRLAHRLRAEGVGHDTLVGLGVERSIDMVVGLFGILKAGGAYVPIDPSFPRDRVAFMLEDSKLEVLVTQRSLVSQLATPRAKAILIDDVTSQDDSRPSPLATPDSRAYVIYTSGSTGVPKGVELPHRAVVNFLSSVAREPGLGASDVMLAVTTLSFDIAVLELYLPLTVGGSVVVASRDQAGSGDALLSTIRARGVTTMQATPSTWRLLLAAGWSASEPLKVLCGGEALPLDLARELTARSESVWNMYGPTETTVWSTSWRVPQNPTRILIGKPLSNTQVHVLDARMRPLPIGVMGELFIGGDGLARGYLDRPELTRERFVSDPFVSGARLYKTGDVARVLADGNLEYFGRNDHQVKLRGYRIELGEIEAALAKHGGVAQAVAIVREVRAGDARLIAYVVARGAAVPDDELRVHLRASLPEYMVPQAFVTLAALPLTPNGKVDRKALPALVTKDDHGGYVEPKSETERRLAKLWQDVLGVGRVGANDDFFLLGGHSLLAAQMLSRLARDHGVVLSLRRVFEASTVAKLAALIDGEKHDATAVKIPKRTGVGRARQSLMQQRLWLLDQIEPGTTTYNLPAAYRLRGALDVKALDASFTLIAERHEAMRTALAWEEDRAVQVVLPALDVKIHVVDLTSIVPADRERILMDRIRRETNTPFDLRRAPLFRVKLYKMDDADHVLFFMPHHAIWDGWSFDAFLRELDASYAAFARGAKPNLPAPPIQYSDFAEWHHDWLDGEELEKQSTYWKKKLSGALPPLELPTDHPRPATMTGAGGFEPFRLSRAEIDALTAVGKRDGATLYMVLLTAFVTLLHRYTNQRDLLVGTPVRGRAQPETEDLLGFFVNTLVLRLDVSADHETSVEPTFRELLARVRAACIEAFAHPDMPFESLVKELDVARDLSRTPIFQAFFSFQDAKAREDHIGDVPFTQLHVMPDAAQTDLTLWVMERGDGMVGGFSYNTDLFEPATIQRVQRQMKMLLAGVAEDPDRSVGTIPIVPEAETRLIAHWNDTTHDYAREACAHTLIEQQVDRTPNAVAVRFGDATITYADLDRRANRLAHQLRAEGVGHDTLVGLGVERSIDMVVGLLGILKAGGAYVPIDPSFPRDRIAFMLTDSKVGVLVTQRSLVGKLSAPGAKVVLVDGVMSQDDARPPPLATPMSRAYVIYTSGSTGTPKGVELPHRAVVNFLSSVADEPGFTARDVMLAVTTLSFDIAVLELYLPLTVGGSVVIASRDEAGSGEALLALIHTRGVTVMQATPSTWRLLLAAGWSPRDRIKVLCGGEALPIDLARELTERSDSVWNMYGPTETTVWSTAWRVPETPTRILIGRPLVNTQVHVLDAQMRPLPIGVLGELYIGGDGLARGYLGRPELTRERFVSDPFTPGARLYKTGDVARMLADGNLEYFGRNDHQVKLRGYRIELGEIEAALAKHGGVAQAVAIVREVRAGDARLIAYVVAQGAAVADDELRAHLRASLPEYMIPQSFVTLEAMPLTPNGKVDRKALPALGAKDEKGGGYVEPKTGTERLLATLWQDVLGVGRVGANDDFFALGGHSLLAAQMLSRLARDHGVVLSLRRVFEASTVAKLAALVDGKAHDAPAVRIPKRSGTGHARQSLMQQRLWFLEQLEPGKTTYNLPEAYRLSGPLDVKALEASFTFIAQRHEAMRTALAWEDDHAVQIVLPTLDVKIDVVDLSTLPAVDRERALNVRIRDESNTSLDITRAPLFRVRLYKIDEGEHVLFFMPHHAIWDGWSFDAFLHELDVAYAAFSRGAKPSLPTPTIQYVDFAEWHHAWLEGEELEKQSKYWMKKLGGSLPPLELPTDHPRPAAMSGAGGFEPLTLARADVDALTEVAKREGATLYMLFLTAFVTLLYRHTNQRDLLIGTPVRGRAQPETEDLLGYFVNTLVLRLDASADAETGVEATFRELLGRVRTACLEAFANPDMPFESLVKDLDVARDLSRTPIFQALFSFQDAGQRDNRIGDLPFTQVHAMPDAAHTDLTLWVTVRADGVEGGFTYNRDLFEPATIARVQRQMKALLASVADDDDRSIATIPIVPEAETKLIAQWNATEMPFLRAARAHDLFEAQARRTPDAVAAVFEDQRITYRELDARADVLARRLRAKGIRRGARAGLAVERSIEMLVGIFGVLKAGGAYVPLDPAFPSDRLAFMCEDAELTVLVTTKHVSETFPHSTAPTLLIDAPDEDAPPFGADGAATPEDPAYVIYTSGSTGRPKGVVLPHRAVVNFLTTMAERPGITASDVVLAVTTLSFDIAVLELYLPLTVGARVVIASRETTIDGASLLEAMRANGVTMLQATPSTWRVLIDAGWNGDPKLKALCGGEALPLDLAAALHTRAREVWNMYGPTETTVWSTCFRIEGALERVPIGKPIGNTQCHVLGANLEPVPIGVRGELYIGGDGVALGYLGRPELTAERFVRDPFAHKPNARMYRTGDHARWTATGDLEFFGRDDGQVKVRGHRIELGEIEARLLERGGLREACVAVREETAGDARLVAYYVPLPGESLTQTELRKHLRGLLPEYMVPQHFIEVDALPKTPNGKIDRKALPSPFGVAAAANEYVPPSTEAEKLVAEVWSEVLGVPQVSAHDNFFNLGGHSLLVLRAIAAIEKRTGKRLGPRSFVIDTLGQLALQLPAQAPVARAKGAVTPPPEDASRSIAQRMLDKVKRGFFR